MAGRDHTGRIRPSIPLDGTLMYLLDGPQPAGRAAHGRPCRRTLTVVTGYT